MSTPTLINLPPPPSDPITPSDMGPGTPNSGTTSLSALSTTAIKDGHQGHGASHGHMHTTSSASNSSTNTLDAERADRISRLAGLERVATLRGASAHLASGASHTQPPPPLGYFDNTTAPQAKERSTVGSASATGSVGGRTTEGDVYDADKMSEDQDDGVSSSAGMSDEGNASLVGFGEAASSTISGPTSASARIAAGARASGGGVGSPTTLRQSRPDSASPMQGVQESNPAMLDGISHGRDTIDTTPRRGGGRDVSMTGQEQAEMIIKERLDEGESGRYPMRSPDEGKGLGKFYFEGK
ncbi:MAG: hypothetical protein Q9191_000913 [Dirinaria sp. TL-2023a]